MPHYDRAARVPGLKIWSASSLARNKLQAQWPRAEERQATRRTPMKPCCLSSSSWRCAMLCINQASADLLLPSMQQAT